MLARVSLAAASVCDVTPEERLRKTKEYAIRRLQEEVRKGPRGTQASLAKTLRITTAHMTNLNSGRSLPGEDVLPRLAEHWGVTRDELEALATGGSPAPSRAPTETSVERDRTIPIIRDVGEAEGYSSREIEFASDSVRGFEGTNSLTRSKTLELLAQARMNLRHVERLLREPDDAGTVTDADSDDPLATFRGGIGDAHAQFARANARPRPTPTQEEDGDVEPPTKINPRRKR